MITYLKHRGSTWNGASVSIEPGFERVIGTGYNARGEKVDGGEYVLVEGWDGCYMGYYTQWCSISESTSVNHQVFNPRTGKVKVVCVDNYEYSHTMMRGTPKADILPQYQEILNRAQIEGKIAETLGDIENTSQKMYKFCDVEVYKGRKVPVGTKGYIFWEKDGPYGLKYGLKTPEGNTVWVAASNCRKTQTITVDAKLSEYVRRAVEDSPEISSNRLVSEIVDKHDSLMIQRNRDAYEDEKIRWKMSKNSVCLA